jgi:putative glutathione S-transferase
VHPRLELEKEKRMGTMIDGVWHRDDPAPDADGRYRRPPSPVRHWVTSDGRAGPSGSPGYPAEPGRYHLVIAEVCPWAHRTWIVRKIKDLEASVSMSIVAPQRSDQGWIFDPHSSRYRDPILGAAALHELYAEGAPGYTGRVTVPILWDRKTGVLVNNESSEIIRMFNAAFDEITGNKVDLYPRELRAEIDALNARTFADLNNGVYRAGFARSQQAYEEAVDAVFDALDFLETRLGTRRYLMGEVPTEADWRVFPTLARFDVAYVGAFRCNVRRLVDYPNLWEYTRDLYQQPGVAETVLPELYKRGYYSISGERNPLGIIPKGPTLDFSTPHRRARLGG